MSVEGFCPKCDVAVSLHDEWPEDAVFDAARDRDRCSRARVRADTVERYWPPRRPSASVQP